jgi:hypothetical protein
MCLDGADFLISTHQHAMAGPCKAMKVHGLQNGQQ